MMLYVRLVVLGQRVAEVATIRTERYSDAFD